MTKTAAHEPETAGERWLHGTQQYQREYSKVIDEIQEMVATMPHNTIEDSMKVVEAVVERNRQFGHEYREKHRKHTGE